MSHTARVFTGIAVILLGCFVLPLAVTFFKIYTGKEIPNSLLVLLGVGLVFWGVWIVPRSARTPETPQRHKAP